MDARSIEVIPVTSSEVVRILGSLNMKELENALKTMSYETFSYHANEEKNDFYNWIKDTVGDEELAELIKDKGKIISAILIGKRVEKIKRLTGIKCPHISPVLECLRGGNGNANCLDPLFHEDCKFRRKRE